MDIIIASIFGVVVISVLMVITQRSHVRRLLKDPEIWKQARRDWLSRK